MSVEGDTRLGHEFDVEDVAEPDGQLPCLAGVRVYAFIGSAAQRADAAVNMGQEVALEGFAFSQVEVEMASVVPTFAVANFECK